MLNKHYCAQPHPRSITRHIHKHTQAQIYPFDTVDPMGLDAGRTIYEWLGEHLAMIVDGVVDADNARK